MSGDLGIHWRKFPDLLAAIWADSVSKADMLKRIAMHPPKFSGYEGDLDERAVRMGWEMAIGTFCGVLKGLAASNTHGCIHSWEKVEGVVLTSKPPQNQYKCSKCGALIGSQALGRGYSCTS